MNDTGNNTIVLVEDEPSVLGVVQRVLEKGGYEVHAFCEPRGALEYMRAAESPTLLLTDVVLPGMSGFELCDVVRARFPDLPVIFTSGYPLEDVHLDGVTLPTNSCLLDKPFGAGQVLEAVRDLVARAA